MFSPLSLLLLALALTVQVTAAPLSLSLSLWPSILRQPDSLSPYRPSINPVSTSSCTLNTPSGTITGALVDGACRYTVRYAQAARWEPSQLVSTLKPIGGDIPSVSDLPPSCPQVTGSYAASESQSEDCLYAVVYAPPAAKVVGKGVKPVMVWIHGGSFMSGSAAAPGLTGSKLAIEGDMLVVVLQYRLGVLGFLPPKNGASDPNLGLNDVITALKGVQSNIRLFGGDASKVTLAGQSSGAGMIRALWGAPAAKGLFRAAILQSDPMAYGLASPSITSALTDAFYAHPTVAKCGSRKECLKGVSAEELVKAQMEVVQVAPMSIPGVAFAEPIRPTYNTPSIPLEPTSSLQISSQSLAIPPSNLALLITTTTNEAGSVTQLLFPEPVPAAQWNETYLQSLSVLVGPERASKIFNSTEYALPATPSPKPARPGKPGNAEVDDTFRETFERLVSDGIWRCANRDAARSWAGAGGRIWVGEWTKGRAYVSNQVGYCAQKGRVCHEDDILPTFGTSPSPSSGDAALHSEVASAWISFIHNLDPNPSSISSFGNNNFATTPPQVKKHGCKSRSDSAHHQPHHDDDNRDSTSGNAADSAELTDDHALRDESKAEQRRPRAIFNNDKTSKTTKWKAFTAISNDADIKAIGGKQVRSCPSGFWGEKVKFDWQIYG